jgi:hypothetical protein
MADVVTHKNFEVIHGSTMPEYEFKRTLNSNLIFSKKDQDWYNKVNRYGWIDTYNYDRVTREFLFFTKPDLNLINKSGSLVSGIKDNSIICDIFKRMPDVVKQLQSSVEDSEGEFNPFMYLLTNAVNSKLDLPSITSESQETTSNYMGVNLQYRGHSLKSDNGYDFSLSFKDTSHLEIYNLAKCYDEYMRMIKLGEASPKKEYIENKILSEQFSIYKFLIGADGETILYYAKLTGCYFTDVPRSDMGDPGDDFKYSLSFHAQFVEDLNPQILKEFSIISCKDFTSEDKSKSSLPVYNSDGNGLINNKWGRRPYITKATKNDSIYGKRVERRDVKYDYFLKWI